MLSEIYKYKLNKKHFANKKNVFFLCFRLAYRNKF